VRQNNSGDCPLDDVGRPAKPRRIAIDGANENPEK
jgi:hypothetical protein